MQKKSERALFKSPDLNDEKFRNELANTPHQYSYDANSDEEEVRIYFRGCSGEDNKVAREVTQLQEAVAASSKVPTFMVELGDNFYPNGVTSVFDSAFDKTFTDIHCDPSLTVTQKVPQFRIAGNHDYSQWSMGHNNAKDAISTLSHQVLFSYLDKDKKYSKKLFDTFFHFNLNSNDLGKYNFPSRFYTLYPKYAELFLLDSSPLVREWLRSFKGKNYIGKTLQELKPAEFKKHYNEYLQYLGNGPLENNQFDWLCRVYRASRVAIKILGLHHPILYTADSREFNEHDAKVYLTNYEINLLKLLKITGPYGEMIGKIFDIEELFWAVVVSAHVHSMYLYNDLKGRCQIGIGTGGRSLQHQRNFSDIDNLLFYARSHGFLEMIITKTKRIIFKFYSIEKDMLIFKKESQESVRDFEDIGIRYFRATVLSGIKKYFQFLDKEQRKSKGAYLKFGGNFWHHDGGVDRANKIKNYLIRKNVDSLGVIVKTIYDMVKGSGKQDSSLKTFIKSEIQGVYHSSLRQLLLHADSKKFLPFGVPQFHLKKSLGFFNFKTTDDIPDKKHDIFAMSCGLQIPSSNLN